MLGITLVALIGGIEACGVAVHLSLVHRLAAHLPREILDHADYMRAGVFYPDAFYGCMSQSDAAEEAHWPPFLAAGAQLVHEKEIAGINADALRAFLLGVFSHQIADVSWHSLGLAQGLLKEMSAREFDDNIDDAHTALDVGGDMIQVHRLKSSGENIDWLSDSWDYNSEDIKAILSRMGYPVSSTQISYCMARGRAALNAELNVAGAGYIRYAQLSPLLYDELEEYFIGGMVDMHEQTMDCLPTYLKWLTKGTNGADPWDVCPVFDGRRPPKGLKTYNHLKMKHHHHHSTDKVVSFLENLRPYADAVKPHKYVPASHQLVHAGPVPEGLFGKSMVAWNGTWVVGAPSANKVYFYNQQTWELVSELRGPDKILGHYSPRFGAALQVVPLGTPQKDYLFVSSPGMSRVDAYDLDKNHRGTVAWPGTQTRYGKQGLKLVGESLAMDWAGLYVGAPYADIDNEPQIGGVFIVPSSQLVDIVTANSTEYVQSDPLVGNTAYSRLGTKIATGGQYILVGAPGEDKVYGYDKLTHLLLLTLEGEPKTGFGGYLLQQSTAGYIAIGAPLDNSDAAQAGKVHIYKNTYRSEYGEMPSFSRFGQQGLIVGNHLYVTSSHADGERGALWKIKLGYKAIEKVSNGPSPYAGGFGASLAANKTSLLTGIPFYDRNGAAALYDL